MIVKEKIIYIKMKRKNLLAVICASLLMSSCVNDSDMSPTDKETNPDKITTAENLISTKDFEVPVVEGYITTVSYKGLLLARTSTPLTIKVPKQSIARGVDDLEIVYSEGQAAQSYSNLWQTVLFEDSKKGDFDYNDLIFHANYQITGNKMTISLHPIALGSTKDIKLGFIWKQGGATGNVVVAENCRENLFGGMTDFINTYKYDKHFDSYAAVETIDLPSASESVSIEWYIVVDKNVTIYAVNQSGNNCLDGNFMPFGFALTTVGSNGEDKTSRSSAASESAWNAMRPNIGVIIDAEPAVPANAVKMNNSTYQAYQAKNNTNYIIEAGDSYSGALQYVNNTTYYVKGTLNIESGSYGSTNNCKIIVLTGGTIKLLSNMDNARVINYGTINFTNNEVIFANGGQLISSKNLDEPNLTIKPGYGALIYIAGDANIKSFEANNTSKSYFGSLKASKNVYATNSASLLVEGSVVTPDFKLDSSGNAFINCSLIASTKIYMSNSTTLHVKGNVSTPLLEMPNSTNLYVMSGAIIETAHLNMQNAGSAKIHVIGDEMGAVIAGLLDMNTGSGASGIFNGNIGLVVNTLKCPNYPTLESLKLGNNVEINSSNVVVPKSECSPGYGNITSEDNGISWFSYPLETVDIKKCYNFDEWKKGNFDFTPLTGAKIFDITNSAPISGKQMKIFQMQ